MKLSITLNSNVEKIIVSRQKLKTHFRFLPEFERKMVTSTTLFLFRNAQTIFCSHRMFYFILVFVILIQEINEAWSSSSVCMATIICVVLLNKLVLSSFGAELVGLDLFFSLNVFTSSITAFCSHFFSNICTFWMFLQFYSESWRFKLLLVLILVIEIFQLLVIAWTPSVKPKTHCDIYDRTLIKLLLFIFRIIKSQLVVFFDYRILILPAIYKNNPCKKFKNYRFAQTHVPRIYFFRPVKTLALSKINSF